MHVAIQKIAKPDTATNFCTPVVDFEQQSARSNAFYRDLTAFDDFSGFTDADNYVSAPADWIVVLADIRGSTKAIDEGRYKDVNLMGAACITAVLNILKSNGTHLDIPYVFGGDGATLLVPRHVADDVREALIKTQALSASRFGLGMRIGMVPVSAVRALGRDIRVAKFRLSPGNHLAMFSGGGVEAVDALVKGEVTGAPYRIEPLENAALPNLEGLTCRWSPISSQRGSIVSLLVAAPRSGDKARGAIFSNVEKMLRTALKADFASLSPATDASMQFHWPPKFVRSELRASAGTGIGSHCGKLAFILAQSALQWVLHRFNKKAGSYDAPVYKQELIEQTDHRRFDDVLRLVIDCTPEQIKAMEDCLESLRANGDIAYGMHTADCAVMTCIVFDLDKSQHVHFVDGGDGGYALAAKQLKAQLGETRVAPLRRAA